MTSSSSQSQNENIKLIRESSVQLLSLSLSFNIFLKIWSVQRLYTLIINLQFTFLILVFIITSINIELQDSENFMWRWYILKRKETSLLTAYLKSYSLKRTVRKMTLLKWLKNAFKRIKLSEFKRTERTDLSFF